MIQMDLSHIRQFIRCPTRRPVPPSCGWPTAICSTVTAQAASSPAGCSCPGSMTGRSSPAFRRRPEKIQQDSQALVVIGIGGSYLGARGRHRVPVLPQL